MTILLLVPACLPCVAVACCEVMSMMKQTAEEGCDVWYRMHGLQGLLLSPPADNPRNVIDYCLYVKHYKVGLCRLCMLLHMQ